MRDPGLCVRGEDARDEMTGYSQFFVFDHDDRKTSFAVSHFLTTTDPSRTHPQEQ